MAAEPSKTRAKVRKIFKKGDTYQCGLCGLSFATLPEVQANMRECTKVFLAEGGAIEAAPKRYRCSFCKRVHDSMDKARECSVNCKKKIEIQARTEARINAPASADDKLKALAQFVKDPAALNALKAAQNTQQAAAKPLAVYKPKKSEILAGENVKFVREKNLFRCLKCKQRYKSAEDARICWDGHGETYVTHLKPKSTDPRYSLDGKKFRCSKCERLYGAVADAISCYDSHTVAPVQRAKKEEESEAFFRDAAKYVCRKCGKKYFSRDEVETCFASIHENSESEIEDIQEDPSIPIPPPKPAINKKDDAEKFYRDGAKYVCRGCSKKYFSRDETLACFATHDQPAGSE
jgi:plastocyanin